MTWPETTQPRAQPVDYDNDLDRFLTNQTATRLFSTSGDAHEPVAEHLQRQHGGGRVLDLGGNGLLARHLQDRGLASAVLDQARYVATAPPPVALADAERLPFADEAFNAVAALLRPGGSFVACAPSLGSTAHIRTSQKGSFWAS